VDGTIEHSVFPDLIELKEIRSLVRDVQHYGTCIVNRHVVLDNARCYCCRNKHGMAAVDDRNAARFPSVRL
jgi:hypothetical protein